MISLTDISLKILKPNEQLAYNKNTHYHSLDHPDMKEVTAWQRGELVFREPIRFLKSMWLPTPDFPDKLKC